MIAVSGKLQSLLGVPEVGALRLTLANFGPQTPTVAGVGVFGRALSRDITVASDGTFTFNVFAQDQISPAGTYYTLTTYDSEGNVVQITAYRWYSNTPAVDLSTFPAFDPTNTAPTPPPVIISQIAVVPWSPAPVFDGSKALTFDLTLAGNTTGAFANGVPGNLYTFLIRQPGGANYNWTPPSNVRGSAGLPLQNGVTLAELFVCLADGSLLYLGGLLYP